MTALDGRSARPTPEVALPVHPTRNALYSFSAWALPLLLTIVVTPLVVQALGAELYGVYAFVVGIATSLAALLSPGRALVRYVATRPGGGLDAAGGRMVAAAALLAAIAGAVVSLALASAAGWAVDDLLGFAGGLRGPARAALVVALGAVPFLMAGQALAATAQGLHRFDKSSRVTLAVAVLLTAGNGALAVGGAPLVALVAWFTAVSLLSCAAYWRLARGLVPSSSLLPLPSLGALMPHLYFGAAVFASQVPGHLLLLFERTWILGSSGAQQFAIYSISMLVGLSLHAATASVGVVLFPIAASAIARGQVGALRGTYRRAAKLAVALLAPAVVTLVVAAAPLLAVWVGEEFAAPGAVVLSWHAVAFGLLGFAVLPWQLVEALGRPRWNAALATSWLVLNGVALVLLTPLWGIGGAAAARLVGMLTIPLYEVVVEYRLFGAPLWRFWARTLASVGAAGVLMAGLQRWILARMQPGVVTLAAVAFLGGSVFVATLWALRYLSPDERRWVRERVFERFQGSERRPPSDAG